MGVIDIVGNNQHWSRFGDFSPNDRVKHGKINFASFN